MIARFFDPSLPKGAPGNGFFFGLATAPAHGTPCLSQTPPPTPYPLPPTLPTPTSSLLPSNRLPPTNMKLFLREAYSPTDATPSPLTQLKITCRTPGLGLQIMVGSRPGTTHPMQRNECGFGLNQRRRSVWLLKQAQRYSEWGSTGHDWYGRTNEPANGPTHAPARANDNTNDSRTNEQANHDTTIPPSVPPLPFITAATTCRFRQRRL